MKYVLTGATGHVGNNVLRYLLEQKEKVKILVRREKDESFAGLDVEVCVGDLLNEDYLNANIKSDSVVIHSAGIVDITKGNEKLMYDTNVVATKKIVDECIRKKAKLIYIGSTDAIYKESKDEKVSEPVDYYPEYFKDNYAVTKATASKYVLEKLNKKELRGCIIIPSAVIGPNDFKISSVGQAFLDCINHKMMGRMKGGYNFIDARDLAQAIYQASINSNSNQYLITGTDVSIDEMIKSIYKHLGRNKLPLYFPLWLVYIGAIFAPMFAKIKGTKPIFTIKMVKTVNGNHNYDNTLAKSELGLKIRSYEESISDSLDWLKEYKTQ